jgi:hypothetical protein
VGRAEVDRDRKRTEALRELPLGELGPEPLRELAVL